MKTGRSAPIFLVSGLLLWPPLALFEIVHLPDIAFSKWVFGLFILGIFLALATCWLGFSYCIRPAPKPPIILVTTLLGIFLCSAMAHHLIRENILQTTVTTFPSLPNLREQTTDAKAITVAPGQAAALADGEKLFKRSCSVCHAFDRRIVGPPLNSVLPKYRGQAEKLRSYVANPVKINPEYPSMPRLGLPEEDIRIIGDWLLEER